MVTIVLATFSMSTMINFFKWVLVITGSLLCGATLVCLGAVLSHPPQSPEDLPKPWEFATAIGALVSAFGAIATAVIAFLVHRVLENYKNHADDNERDVLERVVKQDLWKLYHDNVLAYRCLCNLRTAFWAQDFQGQSEAAQDFAMLLPTWGLPFSKSQMNRLYLLPADVRRVLVLALVESEQMALILRQLANRKDESIPSEEYLSLSELAMGNLAQLVFPYALATKEIPANSPIFPAVAKVQAAAAAAAAAATPVAA